MIDSELASGSSNAQVFESFYQARNCAGIPNVWFLTVILLTVRVDNLITLLEEFREQELPKGLPLSDSENVFQNEVTAVLEDHLSDPDFSVNMLAEQISISRRQLLRKCKRNFDQLPNKYGALAAGVPLNKAQDKNISEVAYAVGFSNLSLFPSILKSGVGSHPPPIREVCRRN